MVRPRIHRCQPTCGQRPATHAERHGRRELRAVLRGACRLRRSREAGRDRDAAARAFRPIRPGGTDQERFDDGMAVRRAVLGDAHVDRAGAGTTDFTADFQNLITRYAWGDIWSRPGLERRMRSAVTLTALIAHGHFEELAMHVRGALKNGLTQNEIKEIILQSAIYRSEERRVGKECR